MNETMAIEAVRAATAGAAQNPPPVRPTADPTAVAAFSDAMGAAPAGEVPFAAQVQSAWQASEAAYQTHLHRTEALCELANGSTPSLAGLSQLHYELCTAGFQLEVTTSIAKKSSDAVSTLVKNG